MCTWYIYIYIYIYMYEITKSDLGKVKEDLKERYMYKIEVKALKYMRHGLPTCILINIDSDGQ
jgi:hypothetical protein